MNWAWRFAAPSAPSTGTSRVLAMPGTGALARIAIEIAVGAAADTAQTVAVSREDNLLCSPDCFLIAAHIAGGAPSGEPASHRSSNLLTQAGRIRTRMRREKFSSCKLRRGAMFGSIQE